MTDYETRATAKGLTVLRSLLPTIKPLNREWLPGECETWLVAVADLDKKIGKSGKNINGLRFYPGEVAMLIDGMEIAHMIFIHTNGNQYRHELLRSLRSAMAIFRRLQR